MSRAPKKKEPRAPGSGKAEPKKARHPWRENIEALTIAVVVALLFKYFILEISKIPSGSMQPTLMGNPETGVFDRVLVDKLSFRFRDPKRFEIVVFKHPLERSRIMVKRLVGMPGEELRILNGDLWTRPDAASEWTILRRPPAVQEEMWKPLEPDAPKRSSWTVIEGGERWRTAGRTIHASGEGRARFRAGSPIRDAYLDGYPDSLLDEIRDVNPKAGRNPVGDLRLAGRVRPEEALRALRVTLTEGTRTYEFTIPGPASPEGARPGIQVSEADDATTPSMILGEPFRLRAGRRLSFAAENLDDRLALEIDGEIVATFEVPACPRPEATVSLSLEGGGGTLQDLLVSRDVHYLPPPGDSSWEATIPEGEYVMLGDNTQDSADARDWKAVRYFWTDENGVERDVRGNHRIRGENPTASWRGADGVEWRRFRDEWGEKHWFTTGTSRPGFSVPHRTVPRELVQGRAVAVFWPVKPHRGLYRLSWLP